MADVLHVGAGTRSSAVAAATTPDIPTGLIAGDLMWMVDEVVQDADLTTAAPTVSGWTLRTSPIGTTRTDGNTAGKTRQAIYTRPWQTGDDPPTVPYNGGASGGHTSRIFAARNVDLNDPLTLGAAVVTALSTNAIGPIAGVAAPAGSLLAVIASCSNNLGAAGPNNLINVLSGDGLTFTKLDEFTHSAGIDQSSIVQVAPVPASVTVTDKTFSGGTWGQLQAVARMVVFRVADPDAPLWVGDVETGDLSQFNIANGGDRETPNEVVVVTSPVRAGGFARRSTVNATTTQSGSQQRAETETQFRDVVPGDDLWFAMSTHLLPGFPTNPGAFQLVQQWKNAGSGSPPLALHVENNRYTLQGGFGYPGGARSMPSQDLGSALTGVWDDWLFQIAFREGPDAGLISIWRNNVQVLANYVPPGGTLYPGLTSYLKIGLYRGTTSPVPASVVHDEMRIGRTRASVETTAPFPATVAVLTVADQVTQPVPPTVARVVTLPVGELVVEPVGPTAARVVAAPVGDVVVDGVPAVAAVRNTDLVTGDVVTETVPVTVARIAATSTGDVVTEAVPIATARAVGVAAADQVAEPVAVRVVRVVHLPVGEVVTAPVAVAVVRVVAVGARDQVVDGIPVSTSSVLATGDLIVEGIPVTVAYGAEVSASRRGLPPVIFLPSTRVIAQDILTGEWLHWDLPIRDLEYTLVLSGATVISGSFEPEIQDLRDLDLMAHGTWLHVEESGLIRASGILQPARVDDQKLSVEARGPSDHAARIPFRGVYSQVGVDPAAVVKHLWQHIQGYPRGNLGVQVHGSTPVRIGTEPSEQVDFVTGGGEQVSFDRGGPYKLDWFENTLIGAEINTLAGDTPFDYVERAQWNADKTDVEHHIDIGYPRIGRRRTDLRFADGENILESAPIEEPDGVYADEVIVQGAGEGASAITGRAVAPVTGRLRMPVVVVDKTIKSTERANARAADELAARLAAMIEVSEIAVRADHLNAPLGSYGPGDEIQPRLVLPHVGAVSPWHRVTAVRFIAEQDAAVLALTRRDEFAGR